MLYYAINQASDRTSLAISFLKKELSINVGVKWYADWRK